MSEPAGSGVEARRGSSGSSSGLSTPPRDLPAHPATHDAAHFGDVSTFHGVEAPSKNSSTAPSSTTAAPAKRPRKRKTDEADAKTDTKEKKTRKPAQPKVPKDPSAPGRGRKKRKTDNDEEGIKQETGPGLAPAQHQQKLTDLMGATQQNAYKAGAPYAPPIVAGAHGQSVNSQSHLPPQYGTTHLHTSHSPSQSVSQHHPTQPLHPPPHIPPRVTYHPNTNPSHALLASTSAPLPRPASSGQHFDPIRGAVSQQSSQTAIRSTPHSPQPPQHVVNRASASPSITSLIDPPPTQQYLNGRNSTNGSVGSAPVSPASQMHRQSLGASQATQPQLSTAARPSQPGSTSVAALLGDADRATAPPRAPLANGTHSNVAPTSAPSAPAPAKAPRKQQESAPIPTGSGLLSALDVGGSPGPSGTSSTNGDGKQGTDIWLTFDLKGKENVTINYAREVERKYGFAALHPRLAARKERSRQLQAAAAQLEKKHGLAPGGSADDMSLDLSDDEKNSESAGGEDVVSLTAAGLPRQRRRKVEDYDREDEFIDDTEMVWEQSALMAKDGFFVYSGPLVQEGEKQTVERADGTVKRGRGRGRGRGGTTRGDAAAARGGGGPGSRGGRGRGTGAVRKPRGSATDRAGIEPPGAGSDKSAAAAKLVVKSPVGRGVDTMVVDKA